MPDGPSRFAYVANSPLMYIDPTGEVSESLPMTGPAGGSLTTGTGQTRYYDSRGNAWCDIDVHFDHGAGTPHIHFWDAPKVRGPAFSLPWGK